MLSQCTLESSFLMLSMDGLICAISDFLIAQLIKNPPAMQETVVRFLSQEDLLEKGMATHSNILAWRIPWIVCGVTKSQTRLRDFHFHFQSIPKPEH